jgi:hypothetical protein
LSCGGSDWTVRGDGGREYVDRLLFYFDPRIGWSLLETIARQHETIPAITSWATAVVAAVVGAILIRNPLRIKVYLVAEAVLALPSLAMFILVVVQNMSPALGGFGWRVDHSRANLRVRERDPVYDGISIAKGWLTSRCS